LNVVTTKATSRYRRWEDLSTRRLFLGLVLGPIGLVVLLVVFGLFDPHVGRLQFYMIGVIGVLVVGVIWMQAAGWIYLLTVARWRQKISRVECLLFGLGLNEFLALALAMLGIMRRSRELASNATALGLIAIVVFVVPIGLLAGWMFWRFGVRPASMPVPDAAVFD